MRRTARGLLALGLAAAGLGLFAVPASAHVTVSPGTATQGGYATLTFKVPNEKDDASTTKVEVNFPAEHPLPSVSYQAKAGWTITVIKAVLPTPLKSEDGQEITERVASIIWEAAGEDTRIKPGTFETFPISAGPLPTDTDTLVFKALQTYSNGEVVRWIEEAAAGSSTEPEHPAPAVKLAAEGAPPAGAAPSADTTAAIDSAKSTADEAKATALEAKTAAAQVADGPSSDQVNVAVGLGIGGIVLALIAAGLGGMALGRREGGGPSSGPPPAF